MEKVSKAARAYIRQL